MADYLPIREAQLVVWTGEFLQNITVEPGAYGLVVQQCTEYQTTRNRFVASYEAVQNPLTRTPPAVERKNVDKRTLVNATRSLVDVVQAWPQMTNEKRRALKISERGKRPVPSPIPTTSPFVKVEKVEGRVATLKFQGNSSTRSRPKGVIGVSIFSAYGAQPPTDAKGWKFETMTGKTTLELALNDTDAAGTVWLTAFWFNGRKESGIASQPISVNLAAATPVPQAAKKLKIAA